MNSYLLVGLIVVLRCLFFHALMGYDMISCFSGRGKKTAGDMQNLFPYKTHAFVRLTSTPCDVEPF
jgi:hypothetical protein